MRRGQENNMKSLVFLLIVIIVGFLFVARTTISFEPLSIKMEKPWLAIGYTLIILGIGFLQFQGEMDVQKIKEDKEIYFDFERDKNKFD